MDVHGARGRDRRAVLRGLGLAGAGALLARGAAAGAQEATPDPRGLPPPLLAYEAAWNARDDGGALAALFAEDGAFEDVPFGQTYRGREQVAAYARAHFAAIADLEIPTTGGFATATRAVNEWVYRGRYAGQFPGLPPGTGQTVELRGAHVLELRGGLIARASAYYDLYGLLVQLGFAPPPAGAATPTG